MDNKRILVQAYEWEGFISLDYGWISKVSGGKEVSSRETVLIMQETYQALVEASKREFDYDFYDDMLECGLNNVADTYIEVMRRDVVLGMGDCIVRYVDELSEIIADIFNGELTLTTK